MKRSAKYQSVQAQETHQEMRYSNATLLYFATPLAFNAPDGRFPWDDLCKIKFLQGQMMAIRYKMAKKYSRNFQSLSRVHERYRWQTDGRMWDSKDPNVWTSLAKHPVQSHSCQPEHSAVRQSADQFWLLVIRLTVLRGVPRAFDVGVSPRRPSWCCRLYPEWFEKFNVEICAL